MIELIGTNAGLVWNALNEGGKMSVKAVKKATKIESIGRRAVRILV